MDEMKRLERAAAAQRVPYETEGKQALSRVSESKT